jgi:hypothetical protein
MNNDPNVNGLEEIISTYRTAVLTCKQDGPTYFTPLLRQVLDNIKAEQGGDQVYYILMILTDGLINDMDSTCDILVEAAYYPLSVIIIGIGNADFGNMIILDGDDVPLTNFKGEKTKRDLVQFVAFKQFEGNSTKLAEEVLQEVPRQVEEFYQLTQSFKMNQNSL